MKVSKFKISNESKQMLSLNVKTIHADVASAHIIPSFIHIQNIDIND